MTNCDNKEVNDYMRLMKMFVRLFVIVRPAQHEVDAASSGWRSIPYNLISNCDGSETNLADGCW